MVSVRPLRRRLSETTVYVRVRGAQQQDQVETRQLQAV